MYVEGIPGAVVGKNRVTVEAYDERGRLTIPADGKYGLRANTQLTVTRGSQDVPLEIP
jgi:DNA-binding transcriptional regulator/RsmH inhibitor MraZ